MAREARLTTSFWAEPSVRALSPGQQHAYLLARTQDDISRCGVVPFRLKRWSKFAKGLTTRSLQRDFDALTVTNPPFVVIDDAEQELFVRTWMHHDGIIGKPNMVIPLVQDFAGIASPTIRIAVLCEIQRIATITVADDDTPIDPADPTLSPVIRGILAILGYPTTDTQRQRIPDGLAEPIHQALAEGFLEPFPRTLPPTVPPNRSGNPSRARTPAPAPAPAPTPAAAAPRAATPASTPATTDDQDHALTLVDHTLNGHASTGEKRRLATHARIALADGVTEHILELALKDWASRDKPQPGLLPSLIGDHLRATHTGATPDQATCAHCGQRIREPSEVARETARHTWPDSELDVVDARWWAQGDPRCPGSPSGLHVLAEDPAVTP